MHSHQFTFNSQSDAFNALPGTAVYVGRWYISGLLVYDVDTKSNVEQFKQTNFYLEMRDLTEHIEVNAPLQTVWDVLADFGGVAKWAPYMRSSRLLDDRKSGVGACRVLHHAWGFRFEESVTDWNDGKGYSFDVFRAPFPMMDVRESWIVEHHDGLTTVTTRVKYDMRLGFAGAFLDWLLVRFIVRREMRAGLRGLKSFLMYEEARTIATQDME